MTQIPLQGSLCIGPYKGYYGRAEFEPEEESFHGRVTETQDVITFVGRNTSELATAFKESIDDYLEFCTELGRHPEKPCSGSFLIRATPKLHRDLTVAATQAGKSFNQYVTEILASAAKVPASSDGANTPGQELKLDTQWQSGTDLYGAHLRFFANMPIVTRPRF